MNSLLPYLTDAQGTTACNVMSPDLKMAQRFLDLLAPDEDFTFQTFADAREDRDRAALESRRPLNLISVLHGRFKDHCEELTRLNRLGAGIFVMVNAGDGEVHAGRKTCRATENVVRVRCLFVDLDGAPVEPLIQHSIPPDILVESSPGRWHAYWHIADCTLDAFKKSQQDLSSMFNGDPTVCDLPRVMRLPGFYHQKHRPFLTKLCSLGEFNAAAE